MKFLHLGDLHLGRLLGGYSLEDDQKYMLEQILSIVRNKKVDAVLVAGDVYDRAIPSEAATNLLDFFLSSLSKEGVKVFVISGNHDSDDRLNFGSNLFASNGIYISSIFDGHLQKTTSKDEFGEIDIYLLPFVKASSVRAFFPDAKIDNYDEAVRTVIDSAPVDISRRNIIVSHQFVAGKGEDPLLGGSEGAAVQTVGLVEKIGYDCFDKFDYAALGHIHSPQAIGRDTVRYSGSPLKYSLSEANNDKSVPVVSFGRKGEVDIELVPLTPLRDLRHIRGPLAEILDKKNITGTDDYIYVTLTDEDPVDNAIGAIQSVYERVIKLDYDNSHTREVETVDIADITEEKSFDELIGDFYRMMYSQEMTQEELSVIREAAREAGIIDEAD